ncbi:hypothetical protein TELCIR_11589 [Teladorsagia circumcincta]|uniref:Uncharacterized protein n=1 Tax=Teladorsagia circumcincta TaxID=45464 RepID=A0A2G9U913_TELCI|nr:hypothetical protein TELCIR_11589 [Teladorsagia circumcincta]
MLLSILTSYDQRVKYVCTLLNIKWNEFSNHCDSSKRLRAGFDASGSGSAGEEEVFTVHEVPFSANTIVVVALAWALVFGIGCLLRTVFAIHWKGYIHVLIPIFGFIACLTTILGFALPEDKSTKAVLASIIAWICCVVVAAGLILLSFFVFTDLKRNKVMEGVRNTALYIVLWLLFTDLLCVVTIIIDVLATVASYKIWKNKKE